MDLSEMDERELLKEKGSERDIERNKTSLFL